MPVASYLVCKINYCTKILEIDGRYITNSNHDKFMTEITEATMKQERRYDISNLVKMSDLNKKPVTLMHK